LSPSSVPHSEPPAGSRRPRARTKRE
jgi:hypothetical protein